MSMLCRGKQVLKDVLSSPRFVGNRIVLTCGCFDLLHLGHIEMLQEAKCHGDDLIVLVNTDESVFRNKGRNPIFSEGYRMKMLMALECVDVVSPLEETTAAEMIRIVKPHVFVKGGDIKSLPRQEAEALDELDSIVIFVPQRTNVHSSSIVDWIRSPEFSEGRRTINT